MSKKYRSCSEANLYHITARGVAKQILFEDEHDYQRFGRKLRHYLDQYDAELFAWCFMSNHVHLLFHAELEAVTKCMRCLLVSHASYFNARHDRTGHLFQNRFDSVPIENEAQLMAVVRYIHRNPLSIPNQLPEEYKWSSYREYLGTAFITNTEFLTSLFSDPSEFVRFHKEWHEEDRKPEKETRKRKALTDTEAIEYAKDLLGIDSITTISHMQKPQRDRCLATLRKQGLTIDQIARLTGIGRNIVQRSRANE